MAGILIARPTDCVVSVVLLLVAADVVFSTVVEVTLFLVVCHGSFPSACKRVKRFAQ